MSEPQLPPRVFVSVHALTWPETSNPLWHRWCSLHSTASLCLQLPGEPPPPPHPMLQQTDHIPLFLPSRFKEEMGISASKRLNAYMEVNINYIKCLGPGGILTTCFSVTRNNLRRGRTTRCSVTEKDDNDHFLLVARGAQMWLSNTEYWPKSGLKWWNKWGQCWLQYDNFIDWNSEC